MPKRVRRSLTAVISGIAIAGLFAVASPAFAAPAPAEPAPTCEAVPQDVAILIDTTGSMSGAISAAQDTAVSAANTISAAGGRVALVEYKDAGDTIVAQTATDFTTDAAAFAAATETLSAYGGGDSPEAVLYALNHTLDNLSWTPSAPHAIILITDETFHDPDVADPTLTAASVTADLNASNTQVFPLLTSSFADGEGQYTALAAATGGFVTTLDGSAETIDEILERLIGEVVSRPWVKFTEESYSGVVGEAIALPTTSGADCAPLDVATWSWTLVEGDPDVAPGADDEASATWGAPGTYAVTVTLTTVDGQTATATTTVVVTAAPTTTPTATETTTPTPTETSTPTPTPTATATSTPTATATATPPVTVTVTPTTTAPASTTPVATPTASAAPGGGLATTGAENVGLLAGGAIALILAGLGTTLLLRRRKA
ncbi:vWA domain-containing protein [Pseudoclavibacter helvolus]|uniref:vWA domain-containing protein n=1 Tax=Pseudoclavibacter helvolus TaxID=255205 RepID=UPI0037355315